MDTNRLRSLPLLAAVVMALTAGLLLPLTPTSVGAQEGEPSEETGVGSAGTQAVTASEASPAATTRYFGQAPFQAIRDAAAATPRNCAISNHGLTILVIAPIFGESSAATAPGSAPSPMTLSRFDEWDPDAPAGSNKATNYGLYAFEQPNTTFRRAFWHPGIGIWQYDSAGVGAPFTAAERMNVSTIAADVALGMAQRYCAASGSDQQKRYAAWAPWGNPCNHCQARFDDLYPDSNGDGVPNDLSLVGGISITGGRQTRTCRFGREPAFTCYLVDPAQAQGSKGWTGDPFGGPPTSPPTPLSHPFYVFERDGHEERHWLREHSGYSTSISAKRLIGANARPRSVPAGSGLDWSADSALCDLVTRTGLCDPVPPPGHDLIGQSISGDYEPFTGDWNGDGYTDVFWYRPGPGPDYRWVSDGTGGFVASDVTSNGSYQPFVGDFDGDGDDDVFWYAAGSAPDFIWWSARPSQSSHVPVNGTYLPVVGDFDADDHDEIFWYAAGTAPDFRWDGAGNRTFSSSGATINGSYLPLVSDFDGDGRDDVFWYGAGTRGDFVWYHRTATSYASFPATVNGTYTPQLGDFDGDGNGDILWYAPGSTPDYTWYGSGRSFSSRPTGVSGQYRPIVVDLREPPVTGGDDVVWYAPGAATDYLWVGNANRTFSNGVLSIVGTFEPLVGQFAGSAAGDVFWYGPGGLYDAMWVR